MAKPKEKLLQTVYRVPETKKKLMEEITKLRGQSYQSLIDESVDLRLGVTEGFWDQIISLSDKLKVSPSLVCANMIIKVLAFQSAWVKVFKVPPPNLFSEFRFDQEGFMTGERLSEALIEEFKELFQKKGDGICFI